MLFKKKYLSGLKCNFSERQVLEITVNKNLRSNITAEIDSTIFHDSSFCMILLQNTTKNKPERS